MNSVLRKLIAGLAIMAALPGCAVNPVTGAREFTIVSEAQEIELGTANYAFMQQAGGGEYDVDPILSRYIQGVGSKLAAVSDRPLPYEFVVLNSSVPNAWALPGGKIAINRGLLTEMKSEAELAAVLGHEIVHAAARHSARQMERGMLLQVAIVGTAIMTSDSDYANLAMGGANVGAQLISQSYGRGAELELTTGKFIISPFVLEKYDFAERLSAKLESDRSFDQRRFPRDLATAIDLALAI